MHQSFFPFSLSRMSVTQEKSQCITYHQSLSFGDHHQWRDMHAYDNRDGHFSLFFWDRVKVLPDNANVLVQTRYDVTCLDRSICFIYNAYNDAHCTLCTVFRNLSALSHPTSFVRENFTLSDHRWLWVVCAIIRKSCGGGKVMFADSYHARRWYEKLASVIVSWWSWLFARQIQVK